MNRILILIISFLCLNESIAQVISGPMLGPVEYRDATIWLEVAPQVTSVELQYRKAGTTNFLTKKFKGELGNEFNPLQMQIGGLDVNTDYEYRFILNGKLSNANGKFHTKDLWQWRKPPPDFSFLVGSCHYGNEPMYDRPGKPYGGDSSIFETMAKEKAAFMLWTGDEWYTREVDYFSKWGLWYRAQFARAMPILQPFFKSMSQYAMWDDHDYGPNDIGMNYALKEESRKIWMSYWNNPSYGENNQGTYTTVNWGDIDLFLTDGRWWRSDDRILDSIGGKPNPDKVMFGKQQMDWLKNSLVFSNAPFKIIVMGSQALNPISSFERFPSYPAEYYDLLDFIQRQKINGVLFFTGDRHHSEIIKLDRPGTYPLYDITVSPLTSGTHSFSGAEKNNPYRVIGVDQKQNYGRISFSGNRGERVMKVDLLGIKGEPLGTWSVSENDLKTPK